MQAQKTNAVQLLPKQGAFIIKKEDGTQIKGRFSMYAIDLFADKMKCDSYLELLKKILAGMKLGDYGELLVIACQDYFRSNPDEFKMSKLDMLDLIDEWGGPNSDDFRSLVKHAIGRLIDATPVKEETPKTETETEKKSDLPGSEETSGN